MELTFKQDNKSNDKISIKNILIESSGYFDESGIDVYFKRNDGFKLNLDKLFKIQCGNIQISLRDPSHVVSMPGFENSILF